MGRSLGMFTYASVVCRNASVVGRNACTVSQPLDAGVVGFIYPRRGVDFFTWHRFIQATWANTIRCRAKGMYLPRLFLRGAM